MLVPRPGYLADARATCDDASALLIADEIQSGLARPGELLALDHEGVRADLYTLGKALGGGILPVSAVIGRRAVLGVPQPGEHGSTFGWQPSGLRGRPRGDRPAGDRRTPVAITAAGRTPACAAAHAA